MPHNQKEFTPSEEKTFNPQPPQSQVVKIDLLNIPNIINLKDIADKEDGNLISVKGRSILDELTCKMSPGRYSKSEMLRRIKEKYPNLSKDDLKHIFPYFPGIIIDYRYNIRATPVRPEFILNPDELYLFCEDDQLKYLVTGKNRKVHEGLIGVGIKDGNLTQEIYTTLSTYLDELKNLYEDQLFLSAEESFDKKEDTLTERHKNIQKSKQGILWNLSDDSSRYQSLFTCVLDIALFHDHINWPSVHAVYRGKEYCLGAGSYGKVKIAYDIHGAKYDVVKVQLSAKTTSCPRDFLEEQKSVVQLGYGSGQLIKRMKVDNKTHTTSAQYNLILDYVDGISLKAFLGAHRGLPLFLLFHIALKILTAIESIHDKKFLHCDIKLANIIYNPATGEIKFVDLGFAMPLMSPVNYKVAAIPMKDNRAAIPDTEYKLTHSTIYIKSENSCLTYHTIDLQNTVVYDIIDWDALPSTFPHDENTIIENPTLIPTILWHTSKRNHTHKEQVAYAHFKGTLSYLAPELISKYETSKVAKKHIILEYSKQTEVYALGVVLKKLLGLSVLSKDEKYNFHTTDLLRGNNTKLEKIIRKMTYPNPNARPMISEVKEALNHVYKKLIPIYPRVVALINVSDYANASKKRKEIFHTALKSTDIIILFDNFDSKKSKLSNTILRRELIDAGLFVQNYIYLASDLNSLLQRIKLDQPQNPDEPMLIYNYCYFHSNRIGQNNVDEIDCIDINKHTTDFYLQLRERTSLVSPKNLDAIKSMLTKNIARLELKKQTEKNHRKIAEFTSYLELINSYYTKRITHIKLFNDLHKWERKIIHERLAFTNLFFKPKTRLKAILQIEAIIQKDLTS